MPEKGSLQKISILSFLPSLNVFQFWPRGVNGLAVVKHVVLVKKQEHEHVIRTVQAFQVVIFHKHKAAMTPFVHQVKNENIFECSEFRMKPYFSFLGME